ncbi:MAG: hypothetical protein Q9163_004920 [Psora crenata]
MYLPRSLISHLYQHLFRSHHPLSPQVLIFVALEPDALCACRILTTLLKYDFIGHKIQPIAGYDDLTRAGETMVSPMKTQNGGSGGVVICLGVGGLVDMSSVLGLEDEGDGTDAAGGVEVWLIDARRPWNLGNVFGGDPRAVPGVTNGLGRSGPPEVVKGEIQATYNPGQGGIIVYDDGDIEEELAEERDAYCALSAMGDIEDDYVSGESDEDENIMESIEIDQHNGRKRKSWSDGGDEGSDSENPRPRQRRRTSSDISISSSPRGRSARRDTSVGRGFSASPSTGEPVQLSAMVQAQQPSERALRRQFHKERRKYNAVLYKYYSLGASYSEPISSILYSLAEDLGREGNDLLWQAIVGVSSLELYGRSMAGVGISTALDSGGSAGWGGERGERIRQVLRDEVRRLNPPDPNDPTKDISRGEASGVIPTTAKSPTDHSIRISPEPRFLLIRHWSLYESMLHSPYLGSRLHIWSEQGRKRLHKLLAKMGVSLSQCKQNYTHMDMDLKRGLRQRLLTYAPLYGLDGLVPPPPSASRGLEGWGFVRSWGWKSCLSAMDVGVIVGAILEVGKSGIPHVPDTGRQSWDNLNGTNKPATADEDGKLQSSEWVSRFWEAYDALDNIEALKQALPTAQHLHRAILRTGTSIIEKRQIRHLKAFRMAVVKEGPDVGLFTHPAALTKLALWVGEAIAEQERDRNGMVGKGGKPTPLVMAGLNEARGVYIVVGTGGGGGVIDFAARARRKARLEEKAKAREARETEREKKRQEKEERRQEADVQDDDEEDDDDDDDESSDEDDEATDDPGYGRNRFGNAFQEVIDETNARVRIDSFEHCVVEVKKEDLSGFLESLSMKAVVG